MVDEATRRGLFITLEGPDGAGKSSQAARLAQAVAARGLPVTRVREPGGTTLGEGIRALLLTAAPGDHDPFSDALLFVAARASLVRESIRPALAAGRVVICDRHADSTLAYQGYGEGLDVEWLRALNSRATGGLSPDLTILIDIETDAALDRRHRGPLEERTRFEASDAHDRAFHDRVRRGYLELAAAEPGRWRVVDGDRDPQLVETDVAAAVEPFLERIAPDRPLVAVPPQP